MLLNGNTTWKPHINEISEKEIEEQGILYEGVLYSLVSMIGGSPQKSNTLTFSFYGVIVCTIC